MVIPTKILLYNHSLHTELLLIMMNSSQHFKFIGIKMLTLKTTNKYKLEKRMVIRISHNVTDINRSCQDLPAQPKLTLSKEQ